MSTPPVELTIREARAVALRAQGFGAGWERQPARVLARLGAIQLDSVNVVARSHDLIAFARIGPTSVEAMHRAVYRARRGFEYWGHAASWLPIEDFRYFLHRMERMRTHSRRWWSGVRSKHAELYEGVLARVRDEGPLTCAAFEDPRGQRGSWWDWKPAKLVLEDLFDQGLLMATARSAGFARVYDLPERVLPEGLDVSDPGEAESARYLLLRGFASHGVATAREAADYFRLRPALWRPALRVLEQSGAVVPVRVEGWKQPAFAPPAALERTAVPRHRPTFLSPFDNLIWERARTEQLYGFHQRLEIYTPAAKRRFGYYVLPLLARGRLAGRADVKLDRATSTLRVHALYFEPPVAGEAAADAAAALASLAKHLGAAQVRVDRAEPRALAIPVRRALAALL